MNLQEMIIRRFLERDRYTRTAHSSQSPPRERSSDASAMVTQQL